MEDSGCGGIEGLHGSQLITIAPYRLKVFSVVEQSVLLSIYHMDLLKSEVMKALSRLYLDNLNYRELFFRFYILGLPLNDTRISYDIIECVGVKDEGYRKSPSIVEVIHLSPSRSLLPLWNVEVELPYFFPVYLL